ncbi:MAG: hypothetical protein ACLS7Z_02825 [Christensenellales bacterium]
MTDSAADFRSRSCKLSVRCVPMTVSFGEDSYTDGVDLPRRDLLAAHGGRSNPRPPATAGRLSARV